MNREACYLLEYIFQDKLQRYAQNLLLHTQCEAQADIGFLRDKDVMHVMIAASHTRG